MQGRVLAGRYRLSDKLGQGGMGSVWRAEHLTLKSQVAVKLMDPSVADSAEALTRFEREALAVAELRSTHIVQVIDYGIDDGTPYIVMELLIGENLGALIRRQGRLTLRDTTHVLSQVARALAVAHGRGVIHRDLKPDNIFISNENGEQLVKVLDFGVAKRIDALAASTAPKTHTGLLLGTPYYMSPEQALGEPGLDVRSDIWSLGIIAYECLTGRLPFEKGTLGALLQAICNERPAPPSRIAEVPVGFDDWFARATARNKVERFATATEAVTHLSALASGTGLRSQNGGLVPTTVVSSVSSANIRGVPAGDLDTESMSPASVTRPSIAERAPWKWVMLGVVGVLALGGAFLSADHAGKTAATASASAVDAELRRWGRSSAASQTSVQSADAVATASSDGDSFAASASRGETVVAASASSVQAAGGAAIASSSSSAAPSAAGANRSKVSVRTEVVSPRNAPASRTLSNAGRATRISTAAPARGAGAADSPKANTTSGGNPNFAGF
ncbi:MAG: serine/threonine-protein kinase [Polyangiaceae bacterium]